MQILMIKMLYPCRVNCNKVYSSISSRNKLERKKDTGIGFNEETKLFHCPTAGCAKTPKYKYNIVNKNRRKVPDNKIFKSCGRELAKKSNRDRYLQ